MAMAAFVEAPFVFARSSFRAVSDVHAARHEIGPPMRAVNRRRHVHTYARTQTYTWRFRVPCIMRGWRITEQGPPKGRTKVNATRDVS